VRSYRQLIASELVLMRWGGFDVTGVSFAVLGVRPLRVAGVLMGKGGTVSGVSYGVCRCAWTLVPWV
jgi:hypothetical protein